MMGGDAAKGGILRRFNDMTHPEDSDGAQKCDGEGIILTHARQPHE
jgi:hypothetical protein